MHTYLPAPLLSVLANILSVVALAAEKGSVSVAAIATSTLGTALHALGGRSRRYRDRR
jgi:hypothetical protein